MTLHGLRPGRGPHTPEEPQRTREYLKESGVIAPFVFRTLKFRNHYDAWTLGDFPERRELRHLPANVGRTPTSARAPGRALAAGVWIGYSVAS
jgi:hypothetical protein